MSTRKSAPARFVVGTGRCGSTLLSRMLSMNERVLNVFELFSGIDPPFRFEHREVTGKELAEQLRLDHPMLTMVMKRGGEVPEVVYPFDDPNSRYVLGDPVPWALAIAIPRISDDPDALYDEMIERVEAAPTRTLPLHYRAIFDWLTDRSGKPAWIERSGGSIDFLPDLVEFFPDARFVHIHRDGHESALSMREYAPLRVSVAVMNGLAGEIEYTHEGLERLEREEGDAIDRLLATESPIELYGKYWSEQITNGDRARQTLPTEKFLDVRFEELVVNPREVLTGISDFLELPNNDGSGWIEHAAALSRGMPRLRAPSLSSGERDRLAQACADAMKTLGR
ncbi:MAG: sulfotransferase [bacterium]|nr:sulfotransferase [bacterium]